MATGETPTWAAIMLNVFFEENPPLINTVQQLLDINRRRVVDERWMQIRDGHITHCWVDEYDFFFPNDYSQSE